MRKPPVPVRKVRGGSDTLAERGLVQLNLVLTEDERRRAHAAAALTGQSTSEWIRALVRTATEAALAK